MKINYDSIEKGSKFYTIDQGCVRLFEAIEQSDPKSNIKYWKCKHLAATGSKFNDKLINPFSALFDNDYEAYLYLYDEVSEDLRQIKYQIDLIETGKRETKTIFKPF